MTCDTPRFQKLSIIHTLRSSELRNSSTPWWTVIDGGTAASTGSSGDCNLARTHSSCQAYGADRCNCVVS